MNLAVLIGDTACMHALMRQWAGIGKPRGRRAPGLHALPKTAVGPGGHTLAAVLQPEEPPAPWPGGDLAWLVPERGPSMLEVGQVRAFLLRQPLPAGSALRVVVCFAPDESEAEAEASLDRIADMALQAVPPGVEAIVEGFWFGVGAPATAEAWLQERLQEVGA